MTSQTAGSTRIQLRPARTEDLPALVAFWNQAFVERRGFRPLTESEFRGRMLACDAHDANGLILAWMRQADNRSSLVGLVHAYRPPPDTPVYQRWGRRHSIAVLFVDPAQRRRGVGGRLLRAAENWLYYCPVDFAGQATPCYGNVEGPQPPLFGSSQRMGVNANDTELLRFLANRGYAVVDPGDVSMSAELANPESVAAGDADVSAYGLQLLRVDTTAPFLGEEPPNRQEHATWGQKGRYAYEALVLADTANRLRGHIVWYPMQEQTNSERTAAIYSFWLEPSLRGNGLGSLLLDQALSRMTSSGMSGSPFHRVEVQTHVVRHSDAVALYETRGFTIDDAWVTLVKT